MTTERIGRLQSLLERIKRNAAKPKPHLGNDLVLSGVQAPRSDVAAGPVRPAVAPAAAKSDVAARRPALSPAATAPATPASPPVAPAAAKSDVVARRPALSPAATAPATPASPPAAPAATKSDVAAQRPALSPAAAAPATPASPPVAPAPPRPAPATAGAPARPVAVPPAVREPVYELELDDLGAAGSFGRPPEDPAQATERGTFDLDEGAAHHVKSAASTSDIDNLSWSEPPVERTTEEPPPPDSSRRTRVASSMEEALASATHDSEDQIPIKTPPPESGRQPADGVYAAAMHGAGGPTAEQLGETLELEAPTAAEIELDIVQVEATTEREELELELPPQSSVLEPLSASTPPEESEREPPHRAREHSQVVEAPANVAAAELDEIEVDALDNTLLSDHAQLALQPAVTARTATGQQVPLEVLQSVRGFAPRSFRELLDASLKL